MFLSEMKFFRNENFENDYKKLCEMQLSEMKFFGMPHTQK